MESEGPAETERRGPRLLIDHSESRAPPADNHEVFGVVLNEEDMVRRKVPTAPGASDAASFDLAEYYAHPELCVRTVLLPGGSCFPRPTTSRAS